MPIRAGGDPGGALGITTMTPSTAVELDTFKHAAPARGVPFEMLTTATFTVWLDYAAAARSLTVSIDPSTAKPTMPLFEGSVDLARLGTAACLSNGAVSWSLVVD